MDPEPGTAAPAPRPHDRSAAPGDDASPALLDALRAARRNALAGISPGTAGRPLLHWMVGRTGSRVAVLIRVVATESGARLESAFAEASPSAALRRALEGAVRSLEDGDDATRDPWIETVVPVGEGSSTPAAILPIRFRGRLLGAIGLAGRGTPYEPSVLRPLEAASAECTLLVRLAAAESGPGTGPAPERTPSVQSAIAQELLQQIVDSLPQRIFWKDRSGFYLGANSAFRTDSGCDPVGLTDNEMPWKGEQAEFFRECDRRVIESERPEMDIVEPILTEDGQQRWLSTCKMPLHDADRRVFAVLGTYLDITSIKRNEIDLERARDAAEAANRAKSDFLATMSHEIRTPLNGVLGYLELALESGLDREQQELVATARTSGLSLLHIINDILDFSKLEAGKFSLEHRTYDLRAVTAGAVEMLAPQAAEQGVDLALVWEDGLPEHVDGDAHRVRQVLVNLIGNAVKFSGDQPVTVTVAPAADERIRFEIIDHGVGIPEAKRDSIFHRFSQADSSTTRRFGGTGLGLAISRRLVEAMGGEIGFESEEGTGSTFHFTLPSGGATVPVRHDVRVGRRVLVVSPEAPAARSLRLELHRRGAEVVTAESLDGAGEVLAAAGSGTPCDVVVVDWTLTQVERIEGRVAAWREDLAEDGIVVLLAPRHSRVDLDAYRQAGVDRFLHKPFTRPEQLDVLVSSAACGTARAVAPEIGVVAPPPERRRVLRILLVEDNAVNQKLARRMLERLRCIVDTADNGRDAVEMAARTEYDAVFMDCQMPVMDGYVATGAIREREAASSGRRVPIVALTANALSGDRIRCLDAGMDDYIAKPFRREEIERALERIDAG